eukprot:6250958-Alexandrium_andersonii.AAC.1
MMMLMLLMVRHPKRAIESAILQSAIHAILGYWSGEPPECPSRPRYSASQHLECTDTRATSDAHA